METFRCKQKVLAYITRNTPNGLELLVFTHQDYPEAGVQVPGGTLEKEENPVAGVLREVKEEAGLEDFMQVSPIGEAQYVRREKQEIHLRQFFQLTYRNTGESSFVHTVTAGEEDGGLVFLYRWVNLDDLPELAGEQGVFLADHVKDSTPPTETQSPAKPPPH